MTTYGTGTASVPFVKNEQGCAAALGNFDGLHRGHGLLLAELKRQASGAGLPALVYTFLNHPLEVVAGTAPKKLISDGEKAELLEQAGADTVYFQRFDASLAEMDCETFVREVLKEKLGVRVCVVGSNYSFGAGGKGTPLLLGRLGLRCGIRVITVSTLKENGVTVSSTLLRDLLREGRTEDYPRYAGRPFSVSGEVVHGREVGRTLGFPTANLVPDEGLALPSHGVYASEVLVDGIRFHGVTNVGSNPTFGLDRVTVETYLDGCGDNLYGKIIRVEFRRKIREEMKFASAEELSSQIHRDILAVREYFDLTSSHNIL